MFHPLSAVNYSFPNIFFFFKDFHQAFFLFIYLFIYLFLAVLGLRFCVRAFSSCSKRGPLFIAVHGPLTIAASLVAKHRLQTRRLSNCGSRAQLLRGMWDPPRPGPEPVSPALAGGLLTTAPPGNPPPNIFIMKNFKHRKSQENCTANPHLSGFSLPWRTPHTLPSIPQICTPPKATPALSA